MQADEGLKNVSGSEIFHTQKNTDRWRQKQNLSQFTVCGNEDRLHGLERPQSKPVVIFRASAARRPHPPCRASCRARPLRPRPPPSLII